MIPFNLSQIILRSQAIMSVAAALLFAAPQSATAEPVVLKLSSIFAEQSDLTRYGIKPFVDGVNSEGKGIVSIEVYPDARLGLMPEQPQLLLDGKADIAWVVPGQTPYRFPDNELLEMPGLFRNAREGTLTYANLLAADALRGYQDFVVIAAFTSEPNLIHSRKPIGSLAALAGQKIRANNAVEAELLARLGATPTVLPAPRLANAIRTGVIDGAALAAAAAIEFGVLAVAKNHYLLRVGVAPLLVLMNRKKFDTLPDAAKAIIRKFSGDRLATSWIAWFESTEKNAIDALKADPRSKVVVPSPADREAAERIFHSMIDAWAAKSARNRELLTLVETELAKLRSTK